MKILAGPFADASYRLEDWWDRLSGKTWKATLNNPACLEYTIRMMKQYGPISRSDAVIVESDEVVYGKIGIFGKLMHVSELGGVE